MARATTKKATPRAAKSATTRTAASTRKAAPTRKTSASSTSKQAAAPSKRATTGKSTPTSKKATVSKAEQKAPTKQAPAKKTTKKTGAKAATAAKASTKTATAAKTSTARKLAVKADEKPWTVKELAEVRGELSSERERLRTELNMAEEELHDLMRDAGDGAGNDQADVGSASFERDHEMSLANNARLMLAQTEHALGRIDDGSYGVCESCGQPVGKMRLMAFPRATLCLSCKQREERR
jgi:RNA polymerase-binding transcription factor